CSACAVNFLLSLLYRYLSRSRLRAAQPPLVPFPPPGGSRGGRVPATPEARRQPAHNGGTHRAAGCPHKRAAAPLCIPRWASRPSASGEVNDERLEERRKTGAVYTKYLTLPGFWTDSHRGMSPRSAAIMRGSSSIFRNMPEPS